MVAIALLLAMVRLIAQEEDVVPGTPIEVELSDDLPILEGRGVHLGLRLAAGPAGLVVVHASSEQFDPFLRIERTDGHVLGEDDDGGGGSTALLETTVPADEELWIDVRAGPAQSGRARIVLHRFPDHDAESKRSLQEIRRQLTQAMKRVNSEEHEQGRTLLRESVARLLPFVRSDPHPETVRLCSLAYNSGIQCNDSDSQRQLLEALVAARSTWFPRGHRSTEGWRIQLASVLAIQGEFERAVPLASDACAALARTVVPDDPDFLTMQANLAEMQLRNGDLPGARRLLEATAARLARNVASDDERLLRVRVQLAVLRMDEGDARAALAILESVRSVWEPRLPPASLDRISLMQNLAVARQSLGDSTGALEIKELLHDEVVRARPAGDPQREMLAVSLVNALDESGQRERARALIDATCAELESTRPPDDRMLAIARMQLAYFKYEAKEYEGLVELDQSIVDAFSTHLPANHPDLQVARFNLAIAKRANGATRDALEMLQSLYESASRELPVGHPVRQDRRAALALTLGLEGKLGRARELVVEGVREAKAVAPSVLPFLGFRAFAEANRNSAELLSLLLSIRDPAVPDGIAVREELDGIVAFRGMVYRRARMAELAEELARNDESLSERLEQARADRSRWLNALQNTNPAAAAKLPELRERMELAERQVLERIAAADVAQGDSSFSAASFTASLADDEVAIVSVEFDRYTAVALDCRPDGRCVAFYLLSRAASPQRIDVALPAAFEDCCAEFRRELERSSHLSRGARPVPDSGPSESAVVVAEVLRPVWPLVPGTARKLVVCPDRALASIPWEAALVDGSALAGDRWQITYVENPARLAPRARIAAPSSLLVLGGIDYGGAWPPLPGAAIEARTAAELWRTAHPQVRVELVTGAAATRERFLELAPEFRYVHLATHAFGSPTGDRLAELRSGDRGIQLGALVNEAKFEPGVLAGLAFAPDSRGIAVLTAAELAGANLSRCELAVLSACETNVGERRFGDAVSGLNQALQTAGARNTITSLWKVDDAGAREFFTAFYAALATDRQSVSAAFSEARRILREKGFGPGVTMAFVLYESR